MRVSVCMYSRRALYVSDGNEWGKHASHQGHKIVNSGLHPSICPSIIERLSESLAPRNVESWIHCSEQIKHGFDGATRAQTHAHT